MSARQTFGQRGKKRASAGAVSSRTHTRSVSKMERSRLVQPERAQGVRSGRNAAPQVSGASRSLRLSSVLALSKGTPDGVTTIGES